MLFSVKIAKEDAVVDPQQHMYQPALQSADPSPE